MSVYSSEIVSPLAYIQNVKYFVLKYVHMHMQTPVSEKLCKYVLLSSRVHFRIARGENFSLMATPFVDAVENSQNIEGNDANVCCK